MSYLDNVRGYWKLCLPWVSWTALAVAVPALAALVHAAGLSAVFVVGIPFVAGLAAGVFLLPLAADLGTEAEPAKLAATLRKGGEFSLEQLAGKAGLEPKAAARALEHLMDLGVVNLAWHRPDGRIHAFQKPGTMRHCPRCAADFPEEPVGKCPNCRVVFSRVVTHKPFQYLD